MVTLSNGAIAAGIVIIAVTWYLYWYREVRRPVADWSWRVGDAMRALGSMVRQFTKESRGVILVASGALLAGMEVLGFSLFGLASFDPIVWGSVVGAGGFVAQTLGITGVHPGFIVGVVLAAVAVSYLISSSISS